MSKKIFLVLVIISLFLPVFNSFALGTAATTPASFGQSNTSPSSESGPTGFVTCGTGSDGEAAKDCNFQELMLMVNRIINYLIMIAIPLAAISFAYAGWLYLSAGDNSSNVSKAKTIFADVGIGLVLVLSAWLIFKLIETTFLNTNAGYATYLK